MTWEDTIKAKKAKKLSPKNSDLKKSPEGIARKKREISEQLGIIEEFVSVGNIENAKIRLHEAMKDIDELKLLMEEYREGR